MGGGCTQSQGGHSFGRLLTSKKTHYIALGAKHEMAGNRVACFDELVPMTKGLILASVCVCWERFIPRNDGLFLLFLVTTRIYIHVTYVHMLKGRVFSVDATKHSSGLPVID